MTPKGCAQRGLENFRNVSNPGKLIWAGAALRLALIVFAALQDKYLKVKYTDIDYEVYTDAAFHMLQGQSPFDRETYRYTPLIAFLVVPNHLLHPAFGKLLFISADIAIACIVLALLKRRGFPRGEIALALAFWLFNPYTCTISSRGSSDSVSSVCLMLMLWFLEEGKIAVAGICYGIAVHIRLFPVIYALPLLVHLGSPPNLSIFDDKCGLRALLTINRSKLSFVFVSGATCIGMCYLCFLKYGNDYLHEALLYHFGRFDLAHNFSPWFYVFQKVEGSAARRALGLAAFVPQVACCVYFGVVKKGSLPLSLCLMTMAFVAMNKVVTAQYFAWYLVLIPLVLPCIQVHRGLTNSCAWWVLAQLNWLLWAYLYEFEHIHSVLVLVFISSILFVSSTLNCIRQLTRAYPSHTTTKKSR